MRRVQLAATGDAVRLGRVGFGLSMVVSALVALVGRLLTIRGAISVGQLVPVAPPR